MLQAFQNWFLRLRRGQRRSPEDTPQLPVRTLLTGLVSSERQPLVTHKVTVNSLNESQLTCKCQELLSEGERMNLELVLPGAGPIVLKVQVDWVLLCSFGHSIGFRVLHQGDSKGLWREFIARLRNPQPV